MSNAQQTSILHEGRVTAVNGRQVDVVITQTSACAACAAANMCHAAQQKQATVSATCQGSVPSVGDVVVVEAAVGQGMWAMLLAYVVPLVLLVGVLSAGVSLLGNEAVAALVALAIVAVYYVALHYASPRLDRRIAFVVRNVIE